MEVDETPASPPTQTQHCSSAQEEALFKSLHTLNDAKQHEACRSTALTIESLFKDHLPPLVKLFEFYRENELLDMALNLFSNIVVKNFDLARPTDFDEHLFNLARSITPSNRPDQFLSDLFARLSPTQQEKVISTVLNRLKSGELAFLKSFATETAASKPSLLTRAEIIEFYSNLAANLDSVRLVKELLVAQPKFIHDHGIYMIDAFLNAEKHVFAAAGSLEVERRSLNVMRRLCVCEFIPCFVRLCVDKLDNRHCYRWIEKSLEFFTKYTIAAIRVRVREDDKSVGFYYETVNLLNENEITGQSTPQQDDQKKEEREKIDGIKRELKDLIEYKNEDDAISPLYNVYTLLNELGKKLEWPVTSSSHAQWPQMSIEQKMSLLFEIKHKTAATDAKSLSMSALNKQISFYGLAFFFHKLIEFHSYSTSTLILVPLFDTTNSTSPSSKPIVIECCDEPSPILENCLANLVFTLELWRKFNQHKEWMTIITKCLNNSKSDGIGYYKNFVADYYNSYLLGLSGTAAAGLGLNWTNVAALPLKRRLSALAYLFINEKASFKSFFNELNRLLSELKDEEENEPRFSASLVFFKTNFDLFEPSKVNIIRYISKLLGEKLNQLIENKRAEKTALLSKRDDFMSILLVLLQPSLDRTANSNVYQTLFQLIVAKSNFSCPQFFDYIYDIQILQDFFMLVNSSSFQSLQLSSEKEKEDKEAISKKILTQVNCHRKPKLASISEFFSKNLDNLITLFDHLV